jgi:RNA polymerase sigma factor (sigma-70 family)
LKDILEYTRAVSERDFRIIYSYYFEGYTLSEVGQKEGLSAEGVRQVHNKIIAKFRKQIKMGDIECN